MSRFAGANATAASGIHVPYALFAEFDFPSGFVRLTSAQRSYLWGGFTWEAVGKLADVGPVKESATLSPERLDFTLSGVDNSLLMTTLGEKYHNRSCKLYKGYLDSQSYELLDTPILRFEGNMDTMTIQTNEGMSVIKLTAENRLIIWSKTAGWCYTDEHQRQFSSTDKFFDQLSRIMNIVIKWGAKDVATGRSGRGGRYKQYER